MLHFLEQRSLILFLTTEECLLHLPPLSVLMDNRARLNFTLEADILGRTIQKLAVLGWRLCEKRLGWKQRNKAQQYQKARDSC
jgi:hypothetical protein